MLEHPAAHLPPTSPDLGDDAIGRLLGGRYELQALVGSGASAHVYLAGDRSLGRQVAVKCLRSGLNADERFRRRFRAEAQSAAQLSNPNLLAVYDWGEDPNAYLVTELLMGGSLLDVLGRSPRLSPSQGLLIALQAAQGLQYAHEFGIVHRDIKPANLLFGEEGRLRIADFGIARAVAEAAWTEPEGVLVGTARYAAPEQALGDSIGDRTDVYSLALTVIEAVTGRVPLLRENALATMVLRQDRDVVDIEELGGLGPALLPAGRADPEARPSAAELIEALTEAARNLPRPERLPLVSPLDLTRRAASPTPPSADVGARSTSFINLATPDESDYPVAGDGDAGLDAGIDLGLSDGFDVELDGDDFDLAGSAPSLAVAPDDEASAETSPLDPAYEAPAFIETELGAGSPEVSTRATDGTTPYATYSKGDGSPGDGSTPVVGRSFDPTLYDTAPYAAGAAEAAAAEMVDAAADPADVYGYGLTKLDLAADDHDMAPDQGVFLEETEAGPISLDDLEENYSDDDFDDDHVENYDKHNGNRGDQWRNSVEATPLNVGDIRRQASARSTDDPLSESLEMRPITRPTAGVGRTSSSVRTRVTGESEPVVSEHIPPEFEAEPEVEAEPRSNRYNVPAAPETVRDVSLPLDQIMIPPPTDSGEAEAEQPPVYVDDDPYVDPGSAPASAAAFDGDGAITRYDLPGANGEDGPMIDVRDEARGRFGDTGPHVVLDSGRHSAVDGPGGPNHYPGGSGDHGGHPLGDGFDDLTIGELVVVDPEGAGGVDGPPVGRAQPTRAIDLSDPELEVALAEDGSRSAGRRTRRPSSGAQQRLLDDPVGQDELAVTGRRSRDEAFQTAFVDEPGATGANDSDRSLIRRWAGPILAGLIALLIVGAAVALLLTSGLVSSGDEGETPELGTAVVGTYLGLTVPEAQVEAQANGWELTVSERREDGTEAGVITRQLPAPGEVLDEGRTLVVEVSLGPELRTVPRVVGLTVDEAAAVLQRSGLRMGVVTERNDAQVDEGRVLTARVEGADASDQVETGTSVDLVVSAGVAAAPMPSFVGLTLDAALTQADDLGMVVTQAQASSETYDEGFVVDTTPPTNTPVAAGDQLTLVVSTGAPFIEVPNVVGLTPAEAADALADAGFNVVDTDGPPNQPVIGTSPAVGASHRKGDDVVIRTSTQ